MKIIILILAIFFTLDFIIALVNQLTSSIIHDIKNVKKSNNEAILHVILASLAWGVFYYLTSK